MSFGGFEQSNSQPMSEINTTPLVDVMLVLLIIFMITAPLMTQSIQVNLPTAEGTPTPEKPEIITLQIGADGNLSWNNESISESTLKQYLVRVSQQVPQPELHLLADKSARYENVAKVMAQARDAGMTKLGFVMQAGADSE